MKKVNVWDFNPASAMPASEHTYNLPWIDYEDFLLQDRHIKELQKEIARLGGDPSVCSVGLRNAYYEHYN